jgi:hypothetical protein
MQIFNNLIRGIKHMLSSQLEFSTAISPENFWNAKLLANAQDAEFFIPFPRNLHEPLRKLWDDPACETWRMWNNEALKCASVIQFLFPTTDGSPVQALVLFPAP